jgi:hypothetical protein
MLLAMPRLHSLPNRDLGEPCFDQRPLTEAFHAAKRADERFLHYIFGVGVRE